MREGDWTLAYIDGQDIECDRAALDMRGADAVEVQVDHTRSKLWVNARGRCLLRLYGIRGPFVFHDLRYRGWSYRYAIREQRRFERAQRQLASQQPVPLAAE